MYFKIGPLPPVSNLERWLSQFCWPEAMNLSRLSDPSSRNTNEPLMSSQPWWQTELRTSVGSFVSLELVKAPDMATTVAFVWWTSIEYWKTSSPRSRPLSPRCAPALIYFWFRRPCR